MSELSPEEIVGNIAAKQLQEAGQRMRDLLRRVGLVAICNGCGCEVAFVRPLGSGNFVAYNWDGTEHMVTCPLTKFHREETGTHHG